MSTRTGASVTERFDMLQTAVSDMHGIPRGQMVPARLYTKLERKGIELANCITWFGINSEFPWGSEDAIGSEFGNDIFIPETSTLVELPWSSRPGRRVGQVLGALVKEGGSPEDNCPRYRTFRQLTKLKSLGYTLSASLVCQFKVYKTGSDFTKSLGTQNSSGLCAYGFLGAETELLDLSRDLRTMGVAVESLSRGEGLGSFELTIGVTEGVTLSDSALRLKQAVRAVMANRGYTATFMSQPHVPGDRWNSGWKLRFTLLTQDKQNAFSVASRDGISDLCKAWIAGLLRHGAALTALYRPTVNCYRKSNDADVPFPTKLDWALDSYRAAVSAIQGQDGQVYLETSLPSSACNPYYLITGTVAAGLDGMESNLSCPEPNSPQAVPVPTTLADALKALGEDDVIKNALSISQYKNFTAIKQKTEVDRFEELEDKENAEDLAKQLERELYYQFV